LEPGTRASALEEWGEEGPGTGMAEPTVNYLLRALAFFFLVAFFLVAFFLVAFFLVAFFLVAFYTLKIPLPSLFARYIATSANCNNACGVDALSG